MTNTDLATPLREVLKSLARVAGYAESLSLDENLMPAQLHYAQSILAACGQLNHAVIARLAAFEVMPDTNLGARPVRESLLSAQRNPICDVG